MVKSNNFFRAVFITFLKSLVKFFCIKALICDTFLIPQNWAVILYLQISFLQKQFNFFTHVIPGILCLEFLLCTIFFKLYCHVLNGLLKQELLNSRHQTQQQTYIEISINILLNDYEILMIYWSYFLLENTVYSYILNEHYNHNSFI